MGRLSAKARDDKSSGAEQLDRLNDPLAHGHVVWSDRSMEDDTRRRAPMSESHKAALAEGRVQGRAIRSYLEALEVHRPKRGRRRTTELMKERLAAIDDELPDADPVRQLQLVQERLDLRTAIESAERDDDLSALEAGFIQAAQAYSERRGISYAAWREAGVPSAVLRAAGITRAG
ncbi:MAG: hypothetical protein ACXV5S_13505 [Acidimicrobiales bacterium]